MPASSPAKKTVDLDYVPLETNEVSMLALLQFASGDPDEYVYRKAKITRSMFSRLKNARLVKVSPRVERLAKVYGVEPKRLLKVFHRDCFFALARSVA